MRKAVTVNRPLLNQAARFGHLLQQILIRCVGRHGQLLRKRLQPFEQLFTTQQPFTLLLEQMQCQLTQHTPFVMLAKATTMRAALRVPFDNARPNTVAIQFGANRWQVALAIIMIANQQQEQRVAS